MFVLLLAMNVLQVAYLEEVLAGLGYASLQPQLGKRHNNRKGARTCWALLERRKGHGIRIVLYLL